MTKVFTVFSDKFKNAEWRADVIKQVTETVTGPYTTVLKYWVKAGFMWASQVTYLKLIAGIAILKIGFFALSAAMIANPIGLIICRCCSH